MMEQSTFHTTPTLLLVVEESLAGEIQTTLVEAASCDSLAFSISYIQASSLKAGLALLEHRPAHALLLDPDVLTEVEREPCVATSQIRQYAPALPIVLLLDDEAPDLIECALLENGTYVRKRDIPTPVFANTIQGALRAGVKRDRDRRLEVSKSDASTAYQRSTAPRTTVSYPVGAQAYTHTPTPERDAVLEALIRNVDAGILVEDSRRRLLYANEIFCRLFGINDLETVLGADGIEGVFASAHDVENHESLTQLLVDSRTKRDSVTATELRCSDGRILSLDYVPVFDDAGTVSHNLWLFRNVTEQRRAVEQRRLHQRTLIALATHPAVAEGRLEEALRLITEEAAAFLDVERANIWRLRPDGKYHCLDAFTQSSGIHEHGETLEPADHPNYFTALAKERVLDAEDVIHDPRTAEFSAQYWQPNGIVSALDALIQLHGQAVGMICHEHTERREWTPDDIAFASHIADLVAQVYLHAETRQHLQEVGLLSRVINITGSATDLQPALQQVCEALGQFFNAPRSAFARISADGTYADVIAEYRVSDEMPSAIGTHIPITDNPSAQHMMATQTPLAVTDVTTDPRLRSVQAVLHRHGIVSILLVPIVSAGNVVGTFGIDALERREFTEEEIALAENVAQQVGQALHRLRLFTRIRKRAELKDRLAAVAGDLNRSFTVEEALTRIGKGALALSNADRIAVYVRTPNDTFCCGWGHDISSEYVARVTHYLNEMSNRRQLHLHQPLQVSDINNIGASARGDDTAPAGHLRRLAEEEEYRAFALWPAIHEGRPVAIIGCYYDDSKHWSTAESEVMQTYARQAAAALESARLFEAEREQRELAEALREVGTVLTASLDFEGVLDRVLEQIGHVIPYDSANVMLIDGEHTVMARTRGYQQLGEDAARAIENLTFNIYETRNLRRLIETREPIVVPDTRYYEGWIETPANRVTRSWVGAPIMIQGDVVAFFGVDKFEPDFYQPEHAERLAMFASQAALALQNARLFEALQQRVQELSTLADTSVALRDAADVSEVGPVLATQASRLVQADAAIVTLVDHDTGESVVVGFEGMPAEIAKQRYPSDSGICGFVIQHREVYRSDNLADDHLVADRGVFAHLGPGLVIPLTTSAGDVVGTLLVGRAHPCEASPPFPAQEEQLLHTLAEMAANTLDRARTHQELESAYVETVLALAKAVDVRDNYTSDHSRQLALLAESTAEELGLDKRTCATIRWAALLHDIGKIGVPDEILRKPGPLNKEEWNIMKSHPEIGAEIVAPVKQLEDVAPLIRAHQERYDGKGYPDGLAGDEIPLGARILAVVDAYSAITDERVYGVARSHTAALEELQRCAGTQFDPNVVEVFSQVLRRATRSI